MVSVPPRAQKPRPYTGYAAAPRIWEGDPPKHTFRPYPVHEPAPAAESRPEAQEQQSTAPAPQEPRLEPLDTGARVIGECFQTYLIAEDKDGLILIDKHAAHERIQMCIRDSC